MLFFDIPFLQGAIYVGFDFREVLFLLREVPCVTCIILHNFHSTNLQTLLENSVLCNFEIKACLNQHKQNKKYCFRLLCN